MSTLEYPKRSESVGTRSDKIRPSPFFPGSKHANQPRARQVSKPGCLMVKPITEFTKDLRGFRKVTRLSHTSACHLKATGHPWSHFLIAWFPSSHPHSLGISRLHLFKLFPALLPSPSHLPSPSPALATVKQEVHSHREQTAWESLPCPKRSSMYSLSFLHINVCVPLCV